MSHIGKPPCDEATILAGAPAAPCDAAGRRWTLVAAILGSSLAFVDGTVVNVALPAIQRAFDASAADAQWVIEAYALLLAALLLVGGALGDRFGRRRIFMLGTAVFVAASLACGAAASVGQLIAARAVQGAGAALLVPGSLALISAAYPASERGRAIGTWSAFSGITAAIGPVIGGLLVDHFSWAWAFWINLPVGALLLVLCASRVPESRSAGATAIDAPGAALATVGLAALVFALIELPARGAADGRVLGAAALALAALAAFGVVEARSAAPMLPLAWFRDRDFAGANLLTLLLYAALGGGLFFLPLNLIQVQHHGATVAGAALLPFIAIMFVLSRWAGTLVDRYGAKRPLVIGPAIAAAGFAGLAWPSVGAGYWSSFFPAVCVLGLGMTVTVAPLTTTVMNAVGADRAGTASGVNNAVSRSAGLLAIAVFGIVLAGLFATRLGAELQRLPLSPELAQALMAQRHKLAGMALPEPLPPELADAVRHAIGTAFVAGFRGVMLLCAGLALLASLSAWWLIGDRRGAAPG